MGRERRRRSRRSSGARPAVPASPSSTPGAAPLEPAAVQEAPRRPSPSTAPAQVRSDRVIERESETMIGELKRVGVVSAVCFGMLAVLAVVDRLQ